MHGGGGGLFAQGLKAHIMIGLVVTAELRESSVANSIWYTMVVSGQFAQMNFVLAGTGH